MAVLKYRVILADPPWFFNDRKAVRRDNPQRKPKSGIGAHRRYSAGTQKTPDICAIGPDVQRVAAPDAYLFCWTTNAHLPDALQVISAWGFVYSKCIAFAWVKTNPVAGTPFYGPGYYTAGNVELCLLARPKGAPCWHPAEGYKPSQIVMAPQVRDDRGKVIHSRKPAEVHERLEIWLGSDMAGHGFLELYATQHRPGWTCLGHALSGNDIRDDLRRLAL